MERWVENARANRATAAFPEECNRVKDYLVDSQVYSHSEANMRVRSIVVFSNVEVDSARDGRNR